MATMIGKKPELAEVGEVYRDDNPLKGTMLKPAEDRGPHDSGCPFETKKPVPYTVYEGDPNKEGFRRYEVGEKAIGLILEKNKVPGGFKTAETINDPFAAAEAAKAVDTLVPMTQTLEPQPVHIMPSVQIAPGPSTALVKATPLSVEDCAHMTEVIRDSGHSGQTEPDVLVRFAGRFGSLQMPYRHAFIDGIALVLIQAGNIQYEPPQDTEELIQISFNGQQYLCHSGIHYKMPDKRTSHTVYLVEREAGEEEK